MALTWSSMPAVARRMLLAGAVLCVVAAAALAATRLASAQDRSGTTIEHWGVFNSHGRPLMDSQLPVVLSLPAPVAEIGSSNSTQYALLTNGTVYAWGQGTEGQLGNGRTSNSPTPVQVRFPAGVKIATIATDVSPFDSGLAIDTTGHAWAWGLNAGGEFCLGNTSRYLTPVQLPFHDVTTLAGGNDHASYDAGGTIYSCGTNQYGQLGDGTTTSSTTPVRVSGLNGAQVSTLVAAWADTGALLSDGNYYDWGYNADGQVGDGTTTSAEVPYLVPLHGAVTLAAQGGSQAGNGQTVVLLSNGSRHAWGDGAYYQLGNDAAGNKEYPVKISALAGVTYTALASGGSTCYGITAAGAVWAWGNNAAGQVGNGTATMAKRPVNVATGATGISATDEDVTVSIAPF